MKEMEADLNFNPETSLMRKAAAEVGHYDVLDKMKDGNVSSDTSRLFLKL